MFINARLLNLIQNQGREKLLFEEARGDNCTGSAFYDCFHAQPHIRIEDPLHRLSYKANRP
jgi:hypothetical protein